MDHFSNSYVNIFDSLQFLFILCVVYLLSLKIKLDRVVYNQHHLQTFILRFHISMLSLKFTLSIETLPIFIIYLPVHLEDQIKYFLVNLFAKHS